MFPKIHFVDKFPLGKELEYNFKYKSFFCGPITILGIYKRSNTTIYIHNSLTRFEKIFVISHELAHWIIHKFLSDKISFHKWLDKYYIIDSTNGQVFYYKDKK